MRSARRGRQAPADLEIALRTVGLIQDACPALVQLSTGVGLEVAFEERPSPVDRAAARR